MAEGNGGSLSSRDRFDRIERALGRIEHKLDEKVDAATLERMGSRLRAVEAGETPVGKILLEDFRKVQTRVEQLWEAGSRQAQDAEARVLELEKLFAQLDVESKQRAAVARAERESIASRYRAFMIMIAAVQALSVIGTIFAVVHALAG